MSRLDNRPGEPGPECICGSELREVPAPDDLAGLFANPETILVHVHNGDTRCYPDSPNPVDRQATAEIA